MKRIVLYLLFSFGIAWTAWILCHVFYVPSVILQFVNMAVMWAPAAAVFLTKKLSGSEAILSTSLRIKLKGTLKYFLAAWLIPIVVTFLGALLFFLVFRDTFDPTLGYLRQTLKQMGLEDGGVSMGALLAAQIILPLLYAPVINSLFALGEEIGWRGFLFPELAVRTCRVKAHLLSGLIWGLWHTPVNMMGHNYGLGYPSYPWGGIIVMCVFTFATGVFLSWLTERSGTIWPAALGHGAINAVAGIPFLFLSVEQSYNRLLGPAVSGLLGAVPLLLFAVFLLVKDRGRSGAAVENEA